MKRNIPLYQAIVVGVVFKEILRRKFIPIHRECVSRVSPVIYNYPETNNNINDAVSLNPDSHIFISNLVLAF